MSRHDRQAAGQLPPNGPSHLFLKFPDGLADWSSFISWFTALLSKKISIP